MIIRGYNRLHSYLTSAGTTTYRNTFLPVQPERRPQAEPPKPRPTLPFQASTNYKDEYRPHELAARPAPAPVQYQPNPNPLSSETTYKNFHKSYSLQRRRGALGVETVNNRFYILIPEDAKPPVSATRIFTSVHDNQQDLSFVVLEGNAPMAAGNRLLGYFDLLGIPPAPWGEPRIEVRVLIGSGTGNPGHDL